MKTFDYVVASRGSDPSLLTGLSLIGMAASWGKSTWGDRLCGVLFLIGGIAFVWSMAKDNSKAREKPHCPHCGQEMP